MDIRNDILNFINNPDAPVARQWCDDAFKLYPYFTLPSILFLKRGDGIGEDERKSLTSRVAICSPDRKVLYSLIGDDSSSFASFYPPEKEPVTPSTNSTIDDFLSKYGNSNQKEIDALNQLIFHPTAADYAQQLAVEEEKNPPSPSDLSPDINPDLSEQDILVNKFIAEQKEKESPSPVPPPFHHASDSAGEPENTAVSIAVSKPADDSTLSESLAKVYIQQHKYSKALEIMQNINLKFPEKSIYFADQIRFLRKLVINENIKNKN